MNLNIRFDVTNSSLPSETRAEVRQVIIDALVTRRVRLVGSTAHREGDERTLAIIEALLDEDQQGSIPE